MTPKREAGDAIRVVLGLLVLGLAGLSVRDGRVGFTEANLFETINRLPDWLEDPFKVVQASAFAAAVAAPLLALASRRWRAARDLVLTVALAWGGSELLRRAVERGRPGGLLRGVDLRGVEATGFGFPPSHVAVAAGLATAASPYLSRRHRRLAWALVALVGVARVYVGAHLPVDVIGGAAVGWTAGAIVHLAFGSAAGRPSLAAVRDALARVGVAVGDLAPVDGPNTLSGHARDGREIVCRVVGRDQRDVDVIDKAWRAVALRDERDRPSLSSQQAVEHAAYVMLLAARAGVHVPAPIVTTRFDGGALLAEERWPGPTLAAVDADSLDHAALDDVWRQVAVLHGARLAHGSLGTANVLLGEGGPYLVDWSRGDPAADLRRRAADVAELLASLSLHVGPERAVASAARVLGPEALEPALPLLQPVVLSPATRREVRAHRGLLGELRERAARAAGVETPRLDPLVRIRPETILVVAVLALAVHVLAPQIGELGKAWGAIRDANPAWVLVALVASLGTYVAGGVAQQGAVRRRLALTDTTQASLAAAFTSRLTPASIGSLALRVRYLERSGLDREEAVTGTALNSLAGGIARVVAIVAAIPLVGGSGFSGVRLPDGWIVLVVVVAAGVVCGAVLLTARGRRLLEPARKALIELRALLKQPAKAGLLLGGALGVIVLNIVCFVASLAAVHAGAGLGTAIVVYLGGSTVGGAAPTPGGLGAVEAALVAGLTAAGIDASVAVAGVLTFRLLTYWLPIPLGYLALRRLRHEGLL